MDWTVLVASGGGEREAPGRGSKHVSHSLLLLSVLIEWLLRTARCELRPRTLIGSQGGKGLKWTRLPSILKSVE